MPLSLVTDLVVGALQVAIAQRRPEDVIHDSDQGSQYASLTFGKHCRDAGIALSMGSVGHCYDNAMAESFFASLECELLDRTKFRNHAEAKADLFRYIEGSTTPIVVTRRSDSEHPSTSRRAASKLLDSPNPNCPRKRGNFSSLWSTIH